MLYTIKIYAYIILLLLHASVSLQVKDHNNEDDDMLAEIIPIKIKRNELNNRHLILKSKRQETPVIEQGQTRKTDDSIVKSEAAKIIGDVNKYGLWEYTSDNTGEGDQLSELMAKIHGADIANEMSAHSLEKQSSDMNEQINKYVETSSNTQPTIDPMETPLGYYPTKSSASFAPSESDVDVVTIPNAMTIEDEHGNSLDTVKTGPIKSYAKVSPTKSMPKDAKFPTHSLAINNPSSKMLHRQSVSPTSSLTLKLLKALKSSPTFRKAASGLLAIPSDTEIDVLKKERKLASFLKAYESISKAKEENEEKLNMLQAAEIDQRSKKEAFDIVRSEPLIHNHDEKLLKVIKHLIGTDNSSNQRGELHSLLNTLRSTERDGGKLESEFLDQPSKLDFAVAAQEEEHSTMSTPYLKHFKEFLAKHKHEDVSPQQKEILAGGMEEQAQPLGTNGPGSPLMGYLEQESAIVSNIKDDSVTPRLQLKKLQESMMEQKKVNENKAIENEKVMIDQFKKLLKEGKKSREENQRIAHQNGDSKQISDPTDNHLSDEKLGEDVYNYMKDSKDYQDFIAAENEYNVYSKSNSHNTNTNNDDSHSHGNLVSHDNENSHDNSNIHSNVDSNFHVNQDSHDNGNSHESILHINDKSHDTGNLRDSAVKSESLEEQLHEIELEKQMLKNKEEHLKLMSQLNHEKKPALQETHKNVNEGSGEKSANTETQIVSGNNKTNKGEEIDHILPGSSKSKEENEDTTLHMLPSNKQTSSSDNSSKNGADDVDHMLPVSTVKVKDNNESNVEHMLPNSKDNEPTSSQYISNSDDNESKKQPISSLISTKNESTTQSESTDSSNDNLENNNHKVDTNKIESRENVSVIHEGEQEEIAAISEKEDRKSNGKYNTKNQEAFIKAEENSKAVYHHTDKEKETKSTNTESSETLDLPINNPTPTDDDNIEPHRHFHHNFHSNFSGDEERYKEFLHFISPIHSPLFKTNRNYQHKKGPSMMDSVDTDAKLPPAGLGRPRIHHHITSILEPPLVSYHTDTNHHAVLTETQPFIRTGSNTMSNVLKHKFIPSASDHHVEREYASFIRPKSSRLKIIDVAASKKGFGKLPVKPRSYLLKELRKKLKYLALKRNLPKKIYVKNKNDKFGHHKFIVPEIIHKHKNLTQGNRSKVLVPISTSNKIITLQHKGGNVDQTNVIVPGSSNSKVINSISIEYQGVNPNDITRSKLPKVKDTNPTIEDVFNIIGSEDQITSRNKIETRNNTNLRDYIPKERKQNVDVAKDFISEIKTNPLDQQEETLILRRSLKST